MNLCVLLASLTLGGHCGVQAVAQANVAYAAPVQAVVQTYTPVVQAAVVVPTQVVTAVPVQTATYAVPVQSVVTAQAGYGAVAQANIVQAQAVKVRAAPRVSKSTAVVRSGGGLLGGRKTVSKSKVITR